MFLLCYQSYVCLARRRLFKNMAAAPCKIPLDNQIYRYYNNPCYGKGAVEFLTATLIFFKERVFNNEGYSKIIREYGL